MGDKYQDIRHGLRLPESVVSAAARAASHAAIETRTQAARARTHRHGDVADLQSKARTTERLAARLTDATRGGR